MIHKQHSQASVRLRNANLHQVYNAFTSFQLVTQNPQILFLQKSNENVYKSHCQYAFVQIFETKCLHNHCESCLCDWNLLKHDAEKPTFFKLSVWSQRVRAYLSDTASIATRYSYTKVP